MMTREKREFLIAVLGIERTDALLAALPRMEQAMERAGIGWKEVAAMGEAMQAHGGATTWADVERFESAGAALDLANTFTAIVHNVLDDSELSTGEKSRLVDQAATELEQRVAVTFQGVKAAPAATPAAAYVADLLQGRQALPATVVAGVKSLRASRAPAAELTASLLEGGAIQSS